MYLKSIFRVSYLCDSTLTRTVDTIKKKNIFDELLPCWLAKPIPNCRAYVDFILFLLFIIPVSKQWNLDQTPSDGELSSVWSNSALFGYVFKYEAIGYVRSHRDGDKIFQNSLVFIIPPANFVCGGYTVFTLSVRVCVRPSVRNVLFF